MENEIYEAPQSEVLTETKENFELARRAHRLIASIIDSLIVGLLLIPFMFFLGYFEIITSGQQPSFLVGLGYGLLGVVIYLGINAKLLINKGQTIGKRALDIKIVLLNGGRPDLKTLTIRYAVYMLPGQVPFVGQLFSLVNVLFIFGKSKRCIHDLAADTRVVKC